MSNALVDYLTMACAGTGQSSFYNTRDEQEAALANAHGDLMRENRRFYALSAALPVNDRSRQMVLENLLRLVIVSIVACNFCNCSIRTLI